MADAGGAGSNNYGAGFGGGGGGGGSGLGAAIFVDSYLNFILQALSGIPTTFNTSNNTTQAGIHGSAGLAAAPMAWMDQHWEIVFSCAQVLHLH